MSRNFHPARKAPLTQHGDRKRKAAFRAMAAEGPIERQIRADLLVEVWRKDERDMLSALGVPAENPGSSANLATFKAVEARAISMGFLPRQVIRFGSD